MNNSQIQSDSQQRGNSGDILIDANEISLTDRSFINSGTGILGKDVEGDGGNIEIKTNKLFLANISSIEAFTRGTGNAGNLSIQAGEEIFLDGGSAITSDVREGGNGDGGSIFLNTPLLKLNSASRLSTSNFAEGSGEAGNINVGAGSIQMKDGSIVAISSSGRGGNVILDLDNTLSLNNNSSISTQAEQAGDGGNININSDFIIAFADGNNDIIANALSGNGGRIEISTQGLFGIESQEELTLGNDISASSEFGLDGVVEINTLEIDPTPRLTELPTAFIASKPLQGCQASREEDSSSFINTGRGGLPPNPYESLDNSNMFVDVRLPSKWTESNVSKETEPIVEADKWVINKNGNIELVADNNLDTTIWKCGDL